MPVGKGFSLWHTDSTKDVPTLLRGVCVLINVANLTSYDFFLRLAHETQVSIPSESTPMSLALFLSIHYTAAYLFRLSVVN